MSTSRVSVAENTAVGLLLGILMTACLTPGTKSEVPAVGAKGEVPVPSVTSSSKPANAAWSSTGPIIVPKSDADHDLVAIKDPTVVRFNDRFHVYASSVSSAGAYNMVYVSFTDWDSASKAPFYYMDKTPGFKMYVAAPQLFYFTPQKKWYLVFQSGPPMFSTADDPGDPTKWSEPASFFANTPPIMSQNGGWLDFWVICDSQLCHMFFSNDHGRWYHSKTPIAKFPYGFSMPVVAMEESEAGRMFEACNVYKIEGTRQYLALIEAFDSTSNGRRYFRSWTAESLDGPWKPVHEDGYSPFAGKENVAFLGEPWTNDISHGEMIRAGYDETMLIEGSHQQYLYQGFEPKSDTANYNKIPWKLALLTQR
jgi:endo-1,4-beta-xylanase